MSLSTPSSQVYQPTDDLDRRFSIHDSTSNPVVRILLAEADDATRAFLIENLTADGYEVAAVGDELAAVGELRHKGVDLVLGDVNGHALALLDTVRGRKAPLGDTPGDVPVIVLTGDCGSVHRTRLLERAEPVKLGETLRVRI